MEEEEGVLLVFSHNGVTGCAALSKRFGDMMAESYFTTIYHDTWTAYTNWPKDTEVGCNPSSSLFFPVHVGLFWKSIKQIPSCVPDQILVFFHAAIDRASIRTARPVFDTSPPPDGQHTFAVAPFVGRVKPRAKNYLSNVEVMYRQGKKKINSDACRRGGKKTCHKKGWVE